MGTRTGYDRPIKVLVEGYICIACDEFKLTRDFKWQTIKKKNGKEYIWRNKMCKECYKKHLAKLEQQRKERNARENKSNNQQCEI